MNLNPGSKSARERGCLCPEGENNGGELAPFSPDGWWLDLRCGLHHPGCTLSKVQLTPGVLTTTKSEGYAHTMEIDLKFEWLKENLNLGDHVGVRTPGFFFWGEYLSYKVTPKGVLFTMKLDSGETITLRLGEIQDLNDAWPNQ